MASKENKVTRAGIIFVEESDKNYTLDLCDEDNEKIDQQIKYVYDNIDNMNFDSVEKSEKTCAFCKYKQLCNLNLF